MASKPRTETLAREQQVLELRRAGLTFDQIASRVGYASRSSARTAYRRALERTGQDQTPQEARKLEVDRLERLQLTLWPKAVKGDLQAIDRVLKISEQRTGLRGTSKAATGTLRAAYDASVAENKNLDSVVDGALAEAGRKIADRIDEAIATGEGQELTKALYLTPHLMNILTKMLATPESRDALIRKQPRAGDDADAPPADVAVQSGKLSMIRGMVGGGPA